MRRWFDCAATELPCFERRGGDFSEMTWADEIHESWLAPTMVFDGVTPVPLIKQFFPIDRYTITSVDHLDVPMSHVRVRQITDRRMDRQMFAPIEGAREKDQTTRKNNVERVRRFIEVRAQEVFPASALVLCQEALETELKDRGSMPENAALRHYNDVRGLNGWEDVALAILIGRTEPDPPKVEQRARVIFEADITEIPQDENGHRRYEKIPRVIRLRDGTSVSVPSSCHPDALAEMVRFAINEGELLEAIGRARGVLRTGENPVAIDVLCNVPLPFEIDEIATWEQIQPSL
jgi:putative DNA primase/helicase